jgi:hypothetical protein
MLKAAKLSWVEGRYIDLEYGDKFFHPHERKAFEAMAPLAIEGRLFS